MVTGTPQTLTENPSPPAPLPTSRRREETPWSSTGGSAALRAARSPLHYPLSSWRTLLRGVPRWQAVGADRRPLEGLGTVAPGGNLSPAFRAAKRLLDIVGALALLVVLGPIMLAVFLVLLITTRGKPLFWQRRAGYCGRPFLMFKFRSMVLGAARRQHEVPNEKDGPVFKNRRDPRITRLGRLLRKTSLDETPQLFQVLSGRMSLVGPRPLPLEEVARLEPWQRQRVAVKPGLTCLWQVSGRSEIGFDDWIRMDLWYVRHQSFWTDLRLLFCTPASVLGCRGAY